jgi:1-acyl-sn-glycerol-3-phosphate acyltransferase
VFFPEGHRSTGSMLPFKKGGFVFAIETATAIVPIGLIGSGSLRARNGSLCRWRSAIRVVVRPPVPTAALTLADRDGLLVRVRGAIASAANQPRSLPHPSAIGPRVLAPQALAPSRSSMGHLAKR